MNARLRFVTFLVLATGGIIWFGFNKQRIMSLTAACRGCNVIIISVDSLRADTLPCYGYRLPTAPNLCRFALEHTIFTRAYANSTWTRPSNMSIMTSLYPPSHGMVDPVPNSLNPAVLTLPKALEKYGYSTRFVSNDQPHMGIELGYERMFQHLRLTDPTFDKVTLNTWFAALDNIVTDNKLGKPTLVYFHTDHIHEYVTNLLHVPKQFPLDPAYKPALLPSPVQFTDDTWKLMSTYLNDLAYTYRVESVITDLHALAAEASGIRTKNDAYAFFLRLPADMQEDIYRNVAEKTYSTRYFAQAVPLYRHLYDEQIRTFDLVISQVFDRIKQNGLEKNTIVIITSDHGQILGERKLLGHIVSLGKQEIYVPLIISVPGLPAKKINDLAQHIDIFPTIMELIGLPVPEQTQGISLAGTILGKPDAPKNTFVISHTTLPHLMYSIETDRWRLIESPYPQGTHRELFDLLTDPGELKSVAQSHEKTTEELTNLLHATLNRLPSYTPLEATFPEWKTGESRENILNK